MTPPRLSWRIVLVRPRNPLNIGAAARAMANFGLHDLFVVAPYEPVWQEARSAIGAEDVLRSARIASDLQEALGKVTLAVGTTTGSRRNLDRDLIPLSEFSAWLQRRNEQGRAALVFGAEKAGLSNEHLCCCQALIRIPTTSRHPSMNLGQAVAVCCYEFARMGAISIASPAPQVWRSRAATLQSLEHVLQRAARLLDRTGFLKPKSRNAQLVKLRRFLLDLELTNHDVRILGGILAQTEWRLENPER